MYFKQNADQRDDQHHVNWSNLECQNPPSCCFFGPWANKRYFNNPRSNPQTPCFCLAISPILLDFWIALGCTQKVVPASLGYAKHQHLGMMQSHSQLARQPLTLKATHLVGPTTGTLPQTSRRFRPRWLHVLGPSDHFWSALPAGDCGGCFLTSFNHQARLLICKL